MDVLEELQQATATAAAKVGPAVVGLRFGWRPGVGRRDRRGPGADLRPRRPPRRGDGRLRRRAPRRPAGRAAVDAAGDVAVIAVETGDAPAIEWREAPSALGTPVFALARLGDGGLRATSAPCPPLGRSFRGPRGRRIAGSIEHTAAVAARLGRRPARRCGRPAGRPELRAARRRPRARPRRRRRPARARRRARPRRGARRGRTLGVGVVSRRAARRMRRAVGPARARRPARARGAGRRPGGRGGRRAGRPDRRRRRPPGRLDRRPARRPRRRRRRRRSPSASSGASREREVARDGGGGLTRWTRPVSPPAADRGRGARRLLPHRHDRGRAAGAVGREPARAPRRRGREAVRRRQRASCCARTASCSPARTSSARTTRRGRAAFIDGAEPAFEVVGRDPLTDLAADPRRRRRPRPGRDGRGRPPAGRPARGRDRQPARPGRPVTAGVVSALGRSLPARSGRDAAHRSTT